MAERPGEGVDPDATVAMPVPAIAADPDATVSMPVPVPVPEPDPEATVSGPILAAPEPDPEVTDPSARSPFYQPGDPDATVAMPPRVETDPDATVAIPTPGKRRNPFAPKATRDAVQADLAALGGLNPLIEVANPILGAVPQIRHALRHPDPGGLRESLSDQLESFEAGASVAGVDEETIQIARHALCALLDESAARTPWGADWSENGLVRMLLDGDTSGEKFFADLEQALEQPIAKGDLLEFFYVCLALGYEGKFAAKASHAQGGSESLQAIRARLHVHVGVRRPQPDGELSERWRGVAASTRQIPGALALWGTASVAALALVALYLSYSSSLGSLSDPVARELAQLSPAQFSPAKPAPVASAAAPAQPAPARPPVERMSVRLAEEIKGGQVAVTEDAQRSTIVVRSDRLFASGSARVETAVEPILVRIAEALQQVPGSVLVTGHTDDLPIRSARFHSNWELSTARAQSVVKLMAAKIADPARLKAEGLADSQPIAANDSELNRARNRRVVIILRAAP